jgi:hypothetical protein
VRDEHVLGAFHVLPGGVHSSTAGLLMEHEPPLGPAHWHGEHPRLSLTPE